MGWLDVGAGAAGGLQKLLAQHEVENRQALAEQIAGENARHSLASEGLQGRTIDENAKLRQQMELDRQQTNRLAEENRIRDDRARMIAMRPTGRAITRPDMESEVKMGVAEPGSYTITPEGAPAPIETAGGEDADTGTVRPERIAWGETASNQNLEESRRLRETVAASTEQARQAALGLGKQREERLREWGPPTVVIGDPNSPTGTTVRSRTAGMNAVGPPTGPMRQTAVDARNTMDQLDCLSALFDAGAKNRIGPAEGRLRMFAQNIPDIPGVPRINDDDFNDFASLSASFMNRDIKAITGAQMSYKEEARIRKEIPQVTDRADVWLSRYKQFRKSIADIQAELASGKRSPWVPGEGNTAGAVDRGSGAGAGARPTSAPAKPIDLGAGFSVVGEEP